MFRKFVAIAALVLVGTQAQAGLLGSALTFNGSEDRISTVNPAGLAAFVNLGGGAGFDPGDVVYGFLASSGGVNDFLTPGLSPFGLGGGYGVAMFAAELVAGPAPGLFNLAPVTTAGYKLEDLVDAEFSAELTGKDAMVAVITGDVGGTVFDGFIAADNTTGDGLKHFTGTDFDLEFAANTADAGSGAGFFQFAPGGGSVGTQKGGFNVIAGVGDLGSAPIVFLDVPITSLFAPPPTTKAHIGLDTTFVNAGVSAVPRGWAFETQSFGIRLNAVPEPSSFLAFAGLVGIAGLGRRRRKNG